MLVPGKWSVYHENTHANISKEAASPVNTCLRLSTKFIVNKEMRRSVDKQWEKQIIKVNHLYHLNTRKLFSGKKLLVRKKTQYQAHLDIDNEQKEVFAASYEDR